MKLLTQQLLKKLPPLYSQPAHQDPNQEMVFHVKLFTPWSNWTWYIAEYDPEQDIAWGYVVGLANEFGAFSIEEIKNLKGPYGLKVEREKWFESTKEKELMENIQKGTD